MGMNRRAAIEMNADERRAYLEAGKTIYLASNGADGYPHLIAMWYALEGDAVLMTTYRKAQKTKNLLQDPRCTLLLEDGATYRQLRGLFVRGHCEVIDDFETTLATLSKVGARAGGAADSARTDDALRARAQKRVTLRFRPGKIRSWDHRKLGGRY